jgi:hypothetical protein
MMFTGLYDVVVAGAGLTGVIAAISAAKEGAKVLLLEAGGILGGLVTGGRLSKPTGLVLGGLYKQFLDKAIELGGADKSPRRSYWGNYQGIFDPSIMERVIIEQVEESGIDVLLYALVTGVVRDDSRVRGILLRTKTGDRLVFGHVFIDCTGDGDVAALSGARFQVGRPQDGRTQPISSYFRVLNVDLPRLVEDCLQNRDDLTDLVLPDPVGTRNEDFCLVFFANGFKNRIHEAINHGFRWISPRHQITLKAGIIPGEINVNATRVHANALDDWERSRAALEVRKQAYSVYDFLKTFVRGFECSVFLEVAPTLGVRETRRILGRYVLTENDVREQKRFDDSIGLSTCAIDIHEPGGDGTLMAPVGEGYGIPYRCLLPSGIEGLLVAGRCISVDEVAFGSTRNTPACALTGEAAGVAAAMAASRQAVPGDLSVRDIQEVLLNRGIPLGTPWNPSQSTYGADEDE